MLNFQNYSKLAPIVLFFFMMMINHVFAGDAPLEVSSEGKVNINTVLHLPPQASPPSNPSDGDFYFTATKELLFFSNGVWNKVMFYSHDWVIDGWTTCSAACAGGTQTRSVICQRSDGQQVPDSYCGTKPAINQACNTQVCMVCKYDSAQTSASMMAFLKGTTDCYAHLDGVYIGTLPSTSCSGSISKDGYVYTKGVYKGEVIIPMGSLGALVYDHYEICRTPQ